VSSFDRLFHILDLFTEEQPVWTADALMEALGSSRATTYRYIKALGSAGLLAPVADGAYMLGPRVIQLDRQIRISDPLLKAGTAVLSNMREKVLGSLILCGFYGDKVLCIYEKATDPRVKSSYERGKSMPMLRGATSKVILAHLPTYHLRNFMLHRSADIAAAGLGEDWNEFRGNLRAIRKAGYFVAQGEVDPGRVGLAAPIFQHSGIIGSMSFVMLKSTWRKANQAKLIEVLVRTAGQISARLADMQKGLFPTIPRTNPSPRKLGKSPE
jgi:DNA-binding IclR family transcriptional regulator